MSFSSGILTKNAVGLSARSDILKADFESIRKAMEKTLEKSGLFSEAN